MIKKLLNKIQTTEKNIDVYVETIEDGMVIIKDNLADIYKAMAHVTKLLEEVNSEREYVSRNIDNLLRDQRNLTNMEVALSSLELIEGDTDLSMDSLDDEEDEDDEDEEEEDEEEEDSFDVCDECGADDLTIETEDGRFLCRDCYRKQVLAEYQQEIAAETGPENVEEDETIAPQEVVEEVQKIKKMWFKRATLVENNDEKVEE